MSNPPQDPNNPRDPDKDPYGDQGRQGEDPPQQPAAPDYGSGQPTGDPQQSPWDRPQYNQPQYGQNAPGYGQPRPGPSVAGSQPPLEHQNPTGQPQSPYGYQSAQPSGYGYAGGPAQFQQPGPVSRPKEVDLAFWLIIGAAIVTAISAIFSLAQLGSPETMEQFEAIMGQQGGEIPIATEDLISLVGTLTVIFALIGIGLYLLIAFMVRKGKNWARITATVLAALSLLTLVGSGVLTWIAVLLGIAAVVLLFRPASSNYFNAVKTRKYSGYGM